MQILLACHLARSETSTLPVACGTTQLYQAYSSSISCISLCLMAIFRSSRLNSHHTVSF